MLGELVKTTTRDGFQLDGAFQQPGGERVGELSVDGFCLIHGTGGNFYSSSLLRDLAERLLAISHRSTGTSPAESILQNRAADLVSPG